MGQALYRKYRSKSLSEIVGQEHVTKTLERAIKSGKISHAYLFTGPRGVGKTSIARILAHEVNSLPYTDESVHLDIIEIDAASNRRIDEIRDLRDKVHIAPTSAKYKVYIIDEVHMLTKEAFNALLKTLEEPPAHVIFILATTEVHKLPETIISRTQRFTFKSIDNPRAVEHLRAIAQKEGIEIDDDALELLAEHGAGSFRDSISLLDQVGNHKKSVSRKDVERLIGVAPHEALEGLLSATLSGVPAEIVKNLASLVEQGITPSQVAKQLSAIVREQFITSTDKQSSELLKSLLSDLLSVPAAHNPLAALELALFGAAIATPSASHQPAPSVPPVTPVSTPKPEKPTNKIEKKEKSESAEAKVEEAEPTETESKAEENTAPTHSDAGFEEWWPHVLQETKKHNNTLYGVLRMAHPECNESTLTLRFSFGFHAKKIADAQTSGKLQSIIKALTGNTYQIQALHDKKAKGKPVAEKQADPVEPVASDIVSESGSELQAITSIFGGGEVLES